MKKVATVFLTIFVVLLLFACDENNVGSESNQSGTDLSNVSDVSDNSDATNVSDVSDNSDVTNVSDVSSVSEVSDVSEISDVSQEESNSVDVSDTSDESKVEVQIKLPFNEHTLEKGLEYILKPEIIGADKSEAVFRSSDTKIAEVDENGKISAKAVGECTISVIVGEVTESLKLTVTASVTTETPSVYDYVYTDYDTFVILGTCEKGATIKVSYEDKVITETSDHGYFSVRIVDNSQTLNLNVTAAVEGKSESAPLEYSVKKEAPNYTQGSDIWRVIVGHNYQFHMRDYGYIESFLRENPFTQSQLDNIKYRINQKVSLIKQFNPDAELIYMPIPSPATIYPDTIPEEYIPYDNKSRIEQIYEVVEESDAILIDVWSALEEHKNDDLKIFWKTDTHWTDYGAFLAYTELFDYIKTRFPGAAPRPMSDFEFVEDFYYGGDIAYYLLQDETLMREYNALRVPNFTMPSSITAIQRYVSDKKLTYTHGIVSEQCIINTGRSNLPTAIVLRDSYNTQIFDILAERFDTTVYNRMWDYTIYTQYLQTYKPDYVIVMGVERNFENMFR